ncbi:MAG TPA: histidine kinase dimerization/phospho-acceptor domain-containing protein, partial [Candidatus Binataceae bacterium]|nr:histidine kinase dimerization/phospho-acceptor domain-containing protein [Candidatus Binataceae bacterium]
METLPRRKSYSSTEACDPSGSLLGLATHSYSMGNERGLKENLSGYMADLAALSSQAQHDDNATAIIGEAIALARDALQTEYCSLYELTSGTQRFAMRHGSGWHFDLTGEFALDDIDDANEALEPPFMADGLAPDDGSVLLRFMRSHHVSGGVHARIESNRGLRGLLAVYTTRGRRFGQAELDFLQLIANIIGTAFTAERVTAERDQAAALEAARLKSAFLANTTHEIRSPLNVIMGYTELVAENLSEAGDHSQARYLEAVKRAGRRLLSTVEKILDYAQLESGNFASRPEPLDAAAMLIALIEEHRGHADEKGLALTCRIEAADTVVSFDRHCLTSVIANPLLNAIKFTEAGHIRVRLYQTSGKLKLEITDSG